MTKDKLKCNVIIFSLIIILIITNVTLLVLYTKSETKEKVILKKKEVYLKREKIDLIQKENIVIFGDSITELYPVEEIYGELPIVKSGVSGYKTQDLLDRMDSMLYQYNPTKVILLIGINDLMPDISEDNQTYVVNNIEKIISLINENRPKAKIYLETIYPVNRKKRKDSREEDNEIIQKVNDRLKEYANGNDITYIDMFSELVDEDGDFDAKYTNDGLHPNTMGYAKITRVLLPYVYE